MLGVAIIHLYTTELIQEHVLAQIKDPALQSFIAPGYLLDHIVVGVFMLPMGFLMTWSAPYLRAKQHWAFVMNLSFCISILSTPVVILWLMTRVQFTSPLFTLSAIIMALVGFVSCSLLLWVRGEFLIK